MTPPVPALGDPATNELASLYIRTRFDWVRTETDGVLAIPAFALHAFHLKQGRYPATLSELVPEYLQRVPVDPFDGGAPLHYRRRDDKYTLWSIGPDGVDNGGVPIDDGSKEKNRRYVVLPDSKGDIVAGINR